jgi:hypothetical protein
MPRKKVKTCKTMTVSELIEHKEKLEAQVKEVDSYLAMAANALPQLSPPPSPSIYNGHNNVPNNMFDTRLINTNKEENRGEEVDKSADVNADGNTEMTPFSIFDAYSWARQEAESSISNNEKDPQEEIDQLKAQIKDNLSS